MLYIGVLIDLAEDSVVEALKGLPFLTIYQKKEKQLLGVIELTNLEDWKEINETLQKIPGFLGLSILSSFQENSS